jgi:glycine cleavage system H protein
LSMSRESFRGLVPDGLLYDWRYDMWVREDGDEVVVGATSFGIFRAGEIIGFTAKPNGAEVDRGRGMGTVECAKTVLAVHAPVSFILLQANEAIEEDPRWLNRDPYERGWMARARASNWDVDRVELLDALAYREHIMKLDPRARCL